MDHFEHLCRLLLEREGYWVRSSFKVNLTKEEKRSTGKHSIPRPEIDLIAYKPCEEKILAIEVKSFFDSPGVHPAALAERHEITQGKYKLFTTKNYREIVFRRLQIDLIESGLTLKKLPVHLGLIAGNVQNKRELELQKLMDHNGWFYWSPEAIKKRVISFAQESYENEASIITAKILLRN